MRMVERRSWVVLEIVVRVLRRLGRDLKTIFWSCRTVSERFGWW